MSNQVYANGREVSCKAAAGKSICAFPDVCFTPPLTPATPPGVPIPYPNTGMSSDTSDGTKQTYNSAYKDIIKYSSTLKQSTSNEDDSAHKKNVVTSNINGKCYFTAYSMDVKIEGENAVRHLDLMTHNHGSTPPGTVPWPYTDEQAMASDSKCKGDKKKRDEACKGKPEPHCPKMLGMSTKPFKEQVEKPQASRAADVQTWNVPELGTDQSRSSLAAQEATQVAEDDECVRKSRCHLKPYNADESKGQRMCCPGQTPHHVPPKACFGQAGYSKDNPAKQYDKESALCVCMEGTNQHCGSHGKNHAAIDHLATQPKPAGAGLQPGDECTIAEYNKICAAAVAAQCGCSRECIQEQLDESLKPTDRKIKHAHSNSSAPLDDKTKANTARHYDALKPPAVAE